MVYTENLTLPDYVMIEITNSFASLMSENTETDNPNPFPFSLDNIPGIYSEAHGFSLYLLNEFHRKKEFSYLDPDKGLQSEIDKKFIREYISKIASLFKLNAYSCILEKHLSSFEQSNPVKRVPDSVYEQLNQIKSFFEKTITQHFQDFSYSWDQSKTSEYNLLHSLDLRLTAMEKTFQLAIQTLKTDGILPQTSDDPAVRQTFTLVLTKLSKDTLLPDDLTDDYMQNTLEYLYTPIIQFFNSNTQDYELLPLLLPLVFRFRQPKLLAFLLEKLQLTSNFMHNGPCYPNSTPLSEQDLLCNTGISARQALFFFDPCSFTNTAEDYMQQLKSERGKTLPFPVQQETAIGRFQFGSVCLKNSFRSTNEDAYTGELISVFGKDIEYFAVFDGHGGGDYSEKARVEFKTYLLTELKKLDVLSIHDPALAADAVHNAFLAFDKDLSTSKSGYVFDPGTTAIVMLAIDDWIITANAGDGRAYCVTNENTVIPLSYEHKPYNPEEKERIQDCGGFVNNYFGDTCQRVCRSLAVSRAFGDYNINTLARSETTAKLISPVPAISIIKRQENDTFIILCDGVSDFFSPTVIPQYLNDSDKEERKSRSPLSMAHALCEKAILNGSQDNVTALVFS
ncbi:PP2C family serine/threonine-protein phosphatase [Thermoproteota archaeon]